VAVLACLGLFVAAIFAPQQAHAANDTAACTVRIIHAKHEGAKFDERLKPLEDRLKKPPLSAWKSFSLVQEHALTLREKTPSTFPVPGDHQGQLELLGTVEGHGMKRLRLRWQILDGAARLLSTVFVIDDGGTLLQAGIKHDNGLLVMGLTCKLGS
jgi:hypothetical protein